MDLPNNSQQFLSSLEFLINKTYEVEKEFKELKHLLEGVIESLPQALWIIDENGEIIIQNKKAQTLPEIINTTNSEIEIDNKVYLIQKSKLQNKTIISATDITKQKRNQRLIYMGQMATHLAHEIRNPIGSISILLSILTKKCKQYDIISEIKQSMFRIERIIKSTLLFSKGLTLKITTFHTQALIDELNNSIKYYPYSKTIVFEYKIPDIKLKADFDLLLLVLQNLIFNAIDAIEDSEKELGKIELIYKESKKFHFFYIYDTGVEVEDKTILFEPFKTTKTKGNGLGLSLSKQIISLHKGKITLTKNKKGFLFFIPKSI